MGKLVRDRIPEIIKAAGGAPEVSVASGAEFLQALCAKLVEEAHELLEADLSDRPEEMADVLEVVDALMAAMAEDPRQILDLQIRKREERGGFEKGYILH